MGATQNSQSCPTAQSPTKTATPVLRAGLTDVLVTGMREPEKEVLYQAIADNLETFLERLRSDGHELPEYVVQEFYRYLDCGILARGFARCACEECGRRFAVAFSCKSRSFCGSCMGRRMAPPNIVSRGPRCSPEFFKSTYRYAPPVGEKLKSSRSSPTPFLCADISKARVYQLRHRR